MPTPPATPFSGKEKWGTVAMYAVLALLGAGLVAIAWRVDRDNAFLQILMAYTCVAVVLTAALAVAAGLTRHLPVLQEGTFDGQQGWGVQAWRPATWLRG